MTKRAREMLDYCLIAINELKQVDFQDKNWQLRWITVACILRSILHVADKIDCDAIRQSKEYRDYWAKKKVEEIFKNFIDSERNLAIKEFSILENKNVKNFYFITQDGKKIITQSGVPFVTQNIIMIGELPLFERLEEAVQWVRNFLDGIDKIFFK